MKDCEQRTWNVPPRTTPPKLLHEGCNLHGAGGRARSPTLWGGTSQETPYLAYGPEPNQTLTLVVTHPVCFSGADCCQWLLLLQTSRSLAIGVRS